MVKNPLVSIIVPCYNQGKFIGNTIDSVRSQTYSNWECIVVNDGSTDNSEDVVLDICNRDNRIKYIKKQNAGLSSARNAGIKNSKGEYLQFLDADDLLEKEKISKTLELYDSFVVDNVIIYSSSRYFEDGEPSKLKVLGRAGLIPHIELKYYDSLEAQTHLIKARNFCVVSAPLYPSRVFNAIGNYDEQLGAWEDWDINLRCSKNGFLFHHECIKDGFTLIRLHDTSMMRNSNHMKHNFKKFNEKHHVRREPKLVRRINKVKRILRRLLPFL